MKIKHIFAISALAVASVAAAQQINPITKAVLDGYDLTLKENPKDYETLYQIGRASCRERVSSPV